MSERSIREVLGTSLGNRVLAKMEKQRRKADMRRAAEDIAAVNDGYFIRPMSEKNVPVPDEGPEQLRLDIGGVPHDE